MAAESPYVNVRESRIGRREAESFYTNVETPNSDGKCEEYQIVQERGRDPHGEYTAAVNSKADLSDATLKRQRMIHSLLFPSQNQTRRFNYTDIQLPPNNGGEEQQEDTEDSEAAVEPHRMKPCVMPKPKLSRSRLAMTEDPPVSDELFQSTDEQGVDDEYVEEYNVTTGTGVCTWKCNAIVLLVVVVVSICISVAAISVAVAAFTSQACEEELMYSSCMIHLQNNRVPFTNNSCNTPIDTDDKVYYS